jgi:hypothetical protein
MNIICNQAGCKGGYPAGRFAIASGAMAADALLAWPMAGMRSQCKLECHLFERPWLSSVHFTMQSRHSEIRKAHAFLGIEKQLRFSYLGPDEAGTSLWGMKIVLRLCHVILA